MKAIICAAVLAAAGTQALAQAPAAPAASSARLSVESSTINEIIANPAAKAVMERALPTISAYYAQIGEMTLPQVAPRSNGNITPDVLKALQAEFDKLR